MSQGMLSGGQAGLVSIDVLRKEQEENRRREKKNQPLEGVAFCHVIEMSVVVEGSAKYDVLLLGWWTKKILK